MKVINPQHARSIDILCSPCEFTTQITKLDLRIRNHTIRIQKRHQDVSGS